MKYHSHYILKIKLLPIFTARKEYEFSHDTYKNKTKMKRKPVKMLNYQLNKNHDYESIRIQKNCLWQIYLQLFITFELNTNIFQTLKSFIRQLFEYLNILKFYLQSNSLENYLPYTQLQKYIATLVSQKG